MNMRKIIAVLAAVLMLCSVIPMGAISVSAADVAIPAVSSWTASTDTATVAEDTDGTIKISYISNYGWAGFWANVEANTDYTLTYKIKGSKASRKTTTHVKDGSWNTIHSEAYTEGDLLLGTDWVERTTTFNSGENTTVLIYVQSGHSSAWDAWLDAISLTVAEGGSETIVDTFVQNGDFETGDLTGWKNSYNGTVQSDVVHGGSYAHKTTNTASKYQGMMQQNPIAVKPNSDYTVTFWYYYEGDNATGSGASFYLYAQTTDNSTNLKSITTYPAAANTWYQVTHTFNTGDNDEIALVWSNRMASDGGTYYFDDVVMSGPAPEGEAPAVPDNAIYFEDFEDGHTWKSNSTSSPESLVGAADLPVANATAQTLSLCQVVAEGDYPYMSDRTGFTVTPNTDYVLSFEALNTTNNWPIQAIIAPNYWLGSAIFTTASQKVTPAAHSWETYTVTFNSGDNTTLYVGLKSQWANSTVYFDNVWIAPLDYTYANDGYLTDGDFEAGGMGWLHTDNTEIIADPTGAGQGNVMHVDENTGSAHVFSQVAENLIAGETYTLSFKVYGYASVTNSAFFLKFPSTCTNFSWGGDLVGYAYSTYVNRFNVNTNTGKWMTATVTFTTSETSAVLNFQNYRSDAGQYYFDDIVLTHNHSYADATCTAPKTCVCGATEGEVADHNYVGEVTEDATCELTGTMTYTCSGCGDSYTEEIPAWHAGNLTHVPAVEATDCANPGHIEYYTCPSCNEYFTDANASEMINPWFINITVDCVKPDDVADCANWTCATCGNENYGAGEHDTGVPACQDGHCSKCDQDIAGYGCANYDTPACGDGVCYYCGGFVAGLGHENGAWAPCQVGECSYGCGLTYPATADHVDEDADDYCDTCWNHLAHDVDPCVGGECSICWTYIEAAHTYDNAFDATCNACGAVRDVVAPITYDGKSASEDVKGLAFKFTVAVDGMEANGTTAIYDNATIGGYKLIEMGATVSNSKSELKIPAVYLCDLEADSASFAVRIINIPEANFESDITAVPYAVVEIDGEQVTLYGEAQTGTYAEIVG